MKKVDFIYFFSDEKIKLVAIFEMLSMIQSFYP